MTPAQLEALARIRGAASKVYCDATFAIDNADSYDATFAVDSVANWSRIITEAAADLTTETVRAQLSASLATGAE